MTLRQKQSRFAQLIGKLIEFAYSQGYELTFACAYHVPCASCGHYEHSEVSKHKVRLALDINLFKNGKYLSSTKAHRPLGEFWESLDPNATWGGRFDDGGHYSFGEH